MKRIKRQADLIAKKFNLPHNEALEFAAKLNGYKDWHQAHAELKKSEENGIDSVAVNNIPLMKAIIYHHDTMEGMDKIGVETEYQKDLKKKGLYEFEVETKAVAEISNNSTVVAKTPQEAAQIVRERINADKLGYDFDDEDWEITGCYQNFCYPMKIVSVSSFDSKGLSTDKSLWNEYEGVEERKIIW